MLFIAQMKDSDGKDYWLTIPVNPLISELRDAWLVGDSVSSKHNTDTTISSIIPIINEKMLRSVKPFNIEGSIEILGHPAHPINKAELKKALKKIGKADSFEELFK